MPNLFNKKILNNRIKDFSVENIDEKIEKIKNWQQSLSKIKGLNEKRLQSAFLKAIFEDILGYENSPQKEEWTLDIEATTDVDAKHPDGILGFFERVDNEEIRGHEGVIELKGPQISLDKDQKRQGTTYKSPVDQAFSYTNKLDKCKWVIVSNFMEIRLYKVGRSKEYYEVFLLDELDEIENFKKFYYLLNKDNLLSKAGESITYKLSEKTLKKEEDISVKFYNLYKNVRINLFEHLKENNPEKNPELLLEKAQKFLDRIIFIGFCEDKGLLPNDLLHEAIQRGKESFSPSNTAVWDQIRGVFRSIDEGNDAHNINAYNGGLFKYDNDLDGLIIENNFFEAIYKISDYDFDSDVDVNILGHIFEQSISDLEKLKSDIKDNEFDENESKRKKDGIFYTPQYITSYIVENAIGGYLEDLKEKLGYYELPDIENARSDSWETRYTKQHLEFYNKYEKNLKEIKVLDPACGSGAFLNQAFDYLLEEHNWLNKQRDLLKGGQSSIFALDSVQRDILKNNIFGVDLNEESVEITKLSLWLKTANKRKTLTNLDDNIKCGNSLIDDPEIAADKAFDWEKEFENIMNDGGFDIVIGNPPYRTLSLGKNQSKTKEIYSDYYSKEYSISSSYKINTYALFIELGFKLVSNKKFNFSYIIPSSFLTNHYRKKLRKHIVDNYSILELVKLNGKVFEDAEIGGSLIFNFSEKRNEDINIVTKIISQKSQAKDIKNHPKNIVEQKNYLNMPHNKFLLSESSVITIKKFKNKYNRLERYCDFYNGIKTGNNKKFISNKKENESYKKILRGKNIDKYIYDFNEEYVLFDPKQLWSNYNEEKYKVDEKIIVRQTSDKIIAAYDNNKFFTLDTTHLIIPKKVSTKYLVAILNSKLMDFYYNLIIPEKNRTFAEVKITNLRGLPLALTTKEVEKIIISKVDKLIKIKKKLKKLEKKYFISELKKYSSNKGLDISKIISKDIFSNEIYSGRARKIRNFTVNINTNIITIYLDKSSSGKYEVLKFEENDKNKRKYIKYYLENLTDEQLNEIDNKYKGNILKKTLQIEIPDYNKDHVVKKVIKEWDNLQQEIVDLENETEKIDNAIDQMVYNLYNLTEEEIKIIENS
ncbi:MAG: hypothetical protein BHK79_07095 [Halanaerobium sp. MDAL1]|nr:MAG: hypothetical protein BHK79_07095 [Halanaerobium sp. MDAL1]